jgi:hypothetical protein
MAGPGRNWEVLSGDRGGAVLLVLVAGAALLVAGLNQLVPVPVSAASVRPT